MTTEFRVCPSCQQIRALADMRGPRCRYKPCSMPRLLAPPAPLPVTRREPPADAVEKYLAERRAAQ